MINTSESRISQIILEEKLWHDYHADGDACDATANLKTT